MLQPFENDIWVNENFGQADLKDARLTKRLCQIASNFAKNPSASLPEQMEGNWKDVKACSRFLNNPNVTHKKVQIEHRKRVIEEAKKTDAIVLFLCDQSEVDYSHLKGTKGLGQVGNQFGKGLWTHNCLAVEYSENPKIIGLAHQIIWKRRGKNSKATIGDQLRKDSESAVWTQSLRAIGTPDKNRKWVAICDRGSDTYEFFSEAKRLKWDAISRAYKDRVIEVNGKTTKLLGWIRSLSHKGSEKIEIEDKKSKKIKEVDLQISFGQIVLNAPERWKGKTKKIDLWVIRCWNEKEGIEWILYSTIRVNTLSEAVEKIKWYAKRWIIEEFHKCMKTGCQLESKQIKTGTGLEILTGIISIISTLMLQLRNLAREKSTELASKVVPDIFLDIICKRYNLVKKKLNIHEFWRAVARMGGFLNRKSDGEPGWQTLWKGWVRLLDMCEGAESLLHMLQLRNEKKVNQGNDMGPVIY